MRPEPGRPTTGAWVRTRRCHNVRPANAPRRGSSTRLRAPGGSQPGRVRSDQRGDGGRTAEGARVRRRVRHRTNRDLLDLRGHRCRRHRLGQEELSRHPGQIREHVL